MHPAFHLNTKFCHLLRAWERVLPEQSAKFDQWRGLAEKFVACLPERYRARNGETHEEVNPFANLQIVFGSNRREQADRIPDLVEQMQEVALHAGLECSRQDHENLVELACSSGLLSRNQESEFFLRAGGTSPRNALEDMMIEMEAEQNMGLGNITVTDHSSMITAVSQTGGIEQDGGATHLVINGHGGCLCRFPILQEGGDVIALQPRDHQGTSVTNLAESIYQTLTAAFPGKRVHEAYEYDFDEGKNYISEITLDAHGNAQWACTVNPRLHDLVRDHLTVIDLSP